MSLWSPAGCTLVWSPRYWKDPLSQSCSPPHWLYLHQSVWLWTGPEVYWRGWALPSATQIHFLSELINNSHSFLSFSSRCSHGAWAVCHGSRTRSINHFHGRDWLHRVLPSGGRLRWRQWGAENNVGTSQSAGWIWSHQEHQGTTNNKITP